MEDITHKFTINSGDNDSSDGENSDGWGDRETDNGDVKLFTSNLIPYSAGKESGLLSIVTEYKLNSPVSILGRVGFFSSPYHPD
jgi:hypothetical protein